MVHVALFALALVRSLVGPAEACTCYEDFVGRGLIYPADGDEVAADAAVFWRGPQTEAAFTLAGPEGDVPLDIEWWVSGAGYDLALVRPRDDLAGSASYEFSDGVTATTFATSPEGASPAAAGAELGSVCIDVGEDCSGDGTTFTLDLPPLASGFYVAELTNEEGDSYRVLGDDHGVRPSGGHCSATFLDASSWATATVRAASVSLAGDVGDWSSTFVGDMPAGGTQCLHPDHWHDDSGECGCSSTPSGTGVALLAVAAGLWGRRRRAGAC